MGTINILRYITLVNLFICTSSNCVDISVTNTGGGYPSEVTFEVKHEGETVYYGAAAVTKTLCLPAGNITIVGKDTTNSV